MSRKYKSPEKKAATLLEGMTPGDFDGCRADLVTAVIIEKKGNLNRAAVYVDDKLAAYVRPRDAQRLKAGQCIDPSRLKELHRQFLRQLSYLQAIRYLGPRDRSADEVRRYLTRKRMAPEIVNEAIDRLRKEGYIDDRAFADKWVAHRVRSAQRSRLSIIQELKQKGITPEAIQNAVAVINEEDLAVACARKKWRQWLRYENPEKEQRIRSYLQRKGFPYAESRKAAQVISQSQKDD